MTCDQRCRKEPEHVGLYMLWLKKIFLKKQVEAIRSFLVRPYYLRQKLSTKS